MFISINHIPVTRGREGDFEKMFRERERAVEDQPGFVSLDVLKPGLTMLMGEKPEQADNVYQVLTRWESEADFRDWLRSEVFKKSHSRPIDATIFDGKSFLTMHDTIHGASASREPTVLTD